MRFTQTAIGFMLHPESTDSATEKFESGYINPLEVVMLPETGVYGSLDNEERASRVRRAQVICAACLLV